MSQLPEDWELVETGNVTVVGAGTGFKVDFQGFTDKEIPFFKVSDMNLLGNEVFMNHANNYVDFEDMKILKAKTFPKNTLIFPKVGAALLTNKRRILIQDSCVDNNIMTLTPIEDKINPTFLYSLYLQIDFNDLSNDGALPSLNGSQVKKIKIPLPPLEEQKKIADILSTVDQKIAFVEDNISQTQELKKGLMQKLLTQGIGHTEFKDSEIGRIPESWEVNKLGELGSLEGGFAFKSKEYNNQGLGYQVIRMSNINTFGLNLIKDPKYLESIEKRAEKYILRREDILITLTGTIGKTDYGNIAFINTDRPMVLNQRVGRYVPKEGNHNKFFYYLFNFNLFRNKFFEFGKGGTGNQANVGKNDFESISVPNVPIEEQKQISKILSTVDQKLEVLKDKKESFKELKKGLMQKLLTGEVRV